MTIMEEIFAEQAKDLTKNMAYFIYGRNLVDRVLKTHPDVKLKQSNEEVEANVTNEQEEKPVKHEKKEYTTTYSVETENSTDNKEDNTTANEQKRNAEQEQEEKSVKHENKEPFKMQEEKPAIAAYSEKAKASTDKAEVKSNVNKENKGKPVSEKQKKDRDIIGEWASRITGRKKRENISKVEEIYDPNNDKILLNIDAAKKAGNMSVLYTSLYELADIAKQLSNKLKDKIDENVKKQLDCYKLVLNYFQIKVEY